MKRSAHRAVALSALVALEGVVVGCSSDANNPDAKIAEQAIGVPPGEGTKESAKVTRKLTVIHDTKVEEKGQVISEKVERTPVEVTQDTKVETDVKVGEKQTPK